MSIRMNDRTFGISGPRRIRGSQNAHARMVSGPRWKWELHALRIDRSSPGRDGVPHGKQHELFYAGPYERNDLLLEGKNDERRESGKSAVFGNSEFYRSGNVCGGRRKRFDHRLHRFVRCSAMDGSVSFWYRLPRRRNVYLVRLMKRSWVWKMGFW